MHLYIFSCGTYVFLPSEVYANKLRLYSELMIFIGYKNNSYCIMCYIQGNVIICFIYTIFNKEFFSKYTDSYIEEYKLYDKLLHKASLETMLSTSDPSTKEKSALASISHTPI